MHLETNTVDFENEAVNVDDVIEMANHFRYIDRALFAVGEYKKLPNEVGGKDTALPEKVAGEMRKLLTSYVELPFH